MDLVGGVSIPDNELAILRSRDEVSPVGRPVHSVNLGQMTLERPLSLHELVLGDRLMGLLRDSTNWWIGKTASALISAVGTT